MTRTLEVALGLGGAYLFLSVIVLALVEGISGFLNRRGKHLQQTLEGMLTQGVANELLAHPIVQSLGKAGERNGKTFKAPSYLGPTMFSQAMTELIAKGKDTKTELQAGYEQFLDGIETKDANARKYIEQIVGKQVASADELKAKLEAWFNNSMDRLSGAYKRNTQWFSRGFALALVFGFNVNTITMAKTLWNDPEARAAAVTIAKKEVERCQGGGDAKEQPPPTGVSDTVGAPTAAAQPPPIPTGQSGGTNCQSILEATSDEIPFPIQGQFWNGAFGSFKAFMVMLFGLLLSFWAVSLGAPFWFDTMRKISGGIQQTGPKPARDDKKSP